MSDTCTCGHRRGLHSFDVCMGLHDGPGRVRDRICQCPAFSPAAPDAPPEFEKFKAERLQNPEVKAAYDAAVVAHAGTTDDEALAVGKWFDWVHDKPINQGDGTERRLWVAGFLAGLAARGPATEALAKAFDRAADRAGLYMAPHYVAAVKEANPYRGLAHKETDRAVRSEDRT